MAKRLKVRLVKATTTARYFEAIFDDVPSEAELEEAMEGAGYHRGTYEGPFGITIGPMVDGKMKVFFHCCPIK